MNRYTTLPLDITAKPHPQSLYWTAFTTQSPSIWKTGENEAQAVGRLVLALATTATPLPSVFERVVELTKALRHNAEIGE